MTFYLEEEIPKQDLDARLALLDETETYVLDLVVQPLHLGREQTASTQQDDLVAILLEDSEVHPLGLQIEN